MFTYGVYTYYSYWSGIGPLSIHKNACDMINYKGQIG